MQMRTDPFRDFDRVVQQVTGTPSRPAFMPLDAYKQGEDFVIHFDLPGVQADSIELTVEKNVLTVKAERRRHAGDSIETLVRERPQGTFSRRLFLGDSLDTDRLEAAYAEGVLTVTLPVAEKAKARRIPVTSIVGATSAIQTQSTDADFLGAHAN
ncbi:MAG TPA: Hsp20/alpha crystallin family protein [Acidimicrobiales bacterium]|nr:Hsp20/alpha crystallin family protein [Acidimicrobiales bacterium]